MTHKLRIRQLLVYPDGPALDFSLDKIKKDRHRLSNSLSNLKVKNQKTSRHEETEEPRHEIHEEKTDWENTRDPVKGRPDVQ